MAAKIVIYQVKDFVKLIETGEIDFDRSRELIREMASAAAFHANHNILVDLRDTTVTITSMDDLMRLSMDMVLYGSLFRHKIANVIPNEKKRWAIAQNFKSCLDIEGFKYEVFTDFEAAIEWLADTSELKTEWLLDTSDLN